MSLSKTSGLMLFAALLVAVCPERVVAVEDSTFAAQLDAIRRKSHVPAIAGAAVEDGRIVEIAASGVRSVDSDEAVTVDDQWHLGSITKSMTATIAAMLVEKGVIRWNSTIGEVLGDAIPEMDPTWWSVTLDQLLSHRGGAPADPPEPAWRRARRRIGTPLAQRLEFVQAVLLDPPELMPRTKFLYSNQGYSIVGVMLEQATGKTWEELMQTMLFIPLGMLTAGFGPPGSPGQLDQPCGHFNGIKDPYPLPPGPNADNPPALGPAATVHCSIRDLAKYAAFHASMGATAPGLLQEDGFEKLHSRVPHENYSLGWCVLKRHWAGGDVLMHTGSNAFWYAAIWVAPEKNLAFVAATNIDSDNADDTCDQVIKAMLDRVTHDRDHDAE